MRAMRGFDITAGKMREVPSMRWTVEWHTEPARPAGMSDEDWANELEDSGPDMAVTHLREFSTREAAMRFAKRIRPESRYGVAIVQAESPYFVEGSAFFWESVGEAVYVE